MTSIICENLSFQYPNSLHPVLDNCTLKIVSGQIIGLIGLNGSGKSTLLKLLSGILSPSKGKVYFDDQQVKNVKIAKKYVTLLPENAKLFLLGPTVLKEFLHFYNSEEEILTLLRSYNLETLIHRKIYELSEGQRRLIAILSALAQQKDIFFLDEPTIGLDSFGRKILFDLITSIKKQNGIIIIATNDTRILPNVDKIIGLKEGQIIIDEVPSNVLPTLQNTIGIVPNQISRLIADLHNKDITLPQIITPDGLNTYLNTLED